MESTQKIEQNTNQLFSLAQKVGEGIILLFDEVILLLAKFAAYDNRWDS